MCQARVATFAEAGILSRAPIRDWHNVRNAAGRASIVSGRIGASGDDQRPQIARNRASRGRLGKVYKGNLGSLPVMISNGRYLRRRFRWWSETRIKWGAVGELNRPLMSPRTRGKVTRRVLMDVRNHTNISRRCKRRRASGRWASKKGKITPPSPLGIVRC